MASAARRYHLRRCLGRGSFGEVYLASMEAGDLRTDVAVKLLNPGLHPRSQAVQRLRDEARMLGLLNHPVILKVHDLLDIRGRLALVTEYVDGADLHQCIVNDRVPIRAVVEAVGQLADALGVAFTAPAPGGAGTLALVHRDVKPANIRLGRHGEVKLLDFGIARASDERREARTETTAIMGTVPYMPPERFERGAAVAPAGDVFALGAVLYEGIVGERLFHPLSHHDAFLLAMDADGHAQFVANRFQRLPAEVPAPLRALMLDMLAFDAADRPDAADVAARCEAMVERLPGAGLRRYCRERTWSDERPPPGPLEGEVLSADPTDLADGADARTSDDLPLGPLGRIAPAEAPEARVAQLPGLTPAGRAARALPWVVALLLALAGLVVGGAGITGVAVVGLFRPRPADGPTAPVIHVSPPDPAPTAPAAPEPEAEPEAEPQPVPAPAPTARPDPRPQPRPSPAAVTGVLAVEGGVPVELRADGRTVTAGRAPPGRYAIWADFGGGWQEAGAATVEAERRTTVRCSKLRHNCTGAPDAP